ncbi:MAG: hypothetical protein QM756_07820 [Polyangiaceae bacterium]
MLRAWSRSLASSLVVVGWLWPRPAAASEGNIQLTWNAPIGCPDREQVLEAIQDSIGGNPAESLLLVRVDVARTDARLVLKLVLKTATATSERTMESTSCDELVRGVALIVALAAGPQADTPPDPEPELAVPVPTASAEARKPSVQAPPDSVSPPPSASAWSGRPRWAPGARLAFDSSSLPSPGVGAALSSRVDFSGWAAGVEASLLAPQSVTTATGGGRFWSAALALRPCLRVAWSRLVVLPCAVFDLEMMVAKGERVTFIQDGVAWFARFGGGAEVSYSLSRTVAFVMGGWALVAPARPTFVIDNTVPVHSPGWLTGRLTTGLELAL